jgi:hypothetical protein
MLTILFLGQPTNLILIRFTPQRGSSKMSPVVER